MSATEQSTAALVGHNIRKIFARKEAAPAVALNDISFEVRRGTLSALVGPDGAGKTTLIRAAAGLMKLDGGTLKVLGLNVSTASQEIQSRIGYMPQKFGLYEDLTVRENLELYADLHGVTRGQRGERYPRLMEMTGLGRFTGRLAGKLSGGMKQKLGLACTLIHVPDLLILDEPTVGVDPLSRRELWDIIFQLVHQENLTVLLSTAYLDEAERCAHVIVLHEGTVLAQGPPEDIGRLANGRVFLAEPAAGVSARGLQARLLDDSGVIDAVPEAGHVRLVLSADGIKDAYLEGATMTSTAARFEDGFMVLLSQVSATRTAVAVKLDHVAPPRGGEAAVEVNDLVRQFGDFTAVDHISFSVSRGEIFGLLGPNGAGKTTTFRMLCGLLPATQGTLRVAGVDLRRAQAAARQQLGYVAQKFALYGDLSVVENLEFFARAYGLRGDLQRRRIAWALDQFDLVSVKTQKSGDMPGGYRQRLAMAAALLHEPDILFLDEPTSGTDPRARREFWKRITSLAEQGVTVIITTHFMEEAEYCDHIVILDQGRILAQGTPAGIRGLVPLDGKKFARMEDAFIAIVADSRDRDAPHDGTII